MKYYMLLLFLSINTIIDTSTIKNNDFYQKLSDSAIALVDSKIEYDPTYYKIAYPNGDVPKGKGVCTDVVIRAYRKLGIDLQKEVHTDMSKNFAKYPKIWGLKSTDTNIDHRRVPNLQVFFTRHGEVKAVTEKAEDYKPGDIVTWMISDKLPHIGIVVNKKTTNGNRYLIVHNVGYGQLMEDCLFKYKLTGHYRYKK